jgi:hypothetical protein
MDQKEALFGYGKIHDPATSLVISGIDLATVELCMSGMGTLMDSGDEAPTADRCTMTIALFEGKINGVSKDYFIPSMLSHLS